jgi:multicomponent Na+:H+ antiporter subunit D
VGQLQLLLFSAVAFVFLQKTGLYPPELRSLNIDVDWIYRKALPACFRSGQAAWARIRLASGRFTVASIEASLRHVRGHHEPPGVLGEPWSIGVAALWAAILLVAYLALAYL